MVLKLRWTDIGAVCVQVAHDENVVRIPVLLNSGMYVHQRIQFYHDIVWVYMDAYQHQLLHSYDRKKQEQ